jgi:uncharacterized protein YbdZ (MbtH family)
VEGHPGGWRDAGVVRDKKSRLDHIGKMCADMRLLFPRQWMVERQASQPAAATVQ